MKSVRVEVFVHFVWSTWDRLPLIRAHDERRLWGAIRATLEGIGCEVLAVGGVADHVHVLARVPATFALSEVVRRAKGASSHFMNQEIAVGTEFRWQGGYGAFSVSRGEVPRVASYILAQAEHHGEEGIDLNLELVEDAADDAVD